MPRALICSVCGGPLPRPEVGARFVSCHFCKTTSDLETGIRQPGVAAQASVGVSAGLKREFDEFQAAYTERIQRGEEPAAAFHGAAETVFAKLCDPDSMTNVVFGMASDFEKAHGIDVTADPVAAPRLAQAYLMAIQELQTHSQHEINLPFLIATKEGPLHFSQIVTIARFTELASQPPRRRITPPGRDDQREPRGTEDPGAAPGEPPKQWWKRLFG